MAAALAAATVAAVGTTARARVAPGSLYHNHLFLGDLVVVVHVVHLKGELQLFFFGVEVLRLFFVPCQGCALALTRRRLGTESSQNSRELECNEMKM